MNTHTILLTQYCAKASSSPLYLGTAGSHGNEYLKITLGEGWESLTVQVIFHPCQVAIQLPTTCVLEVPWEATAEPLTGLQGRIVFQGFNADRLVNSTDLVYTVAAHSSTISRSEKLYTPSIIENVLNQMQIYKNDILATFHQTAQSGAETLLVQVRQTVSNALQQAKDSGEFDGSQGPKGDTGAPGIGEEEYDALFAAMLNGSNTTRLFWIWWSSTKSTGITKYQRLERFAKILALSAQDKTYTVRFFNDTFSSDYTGTPLDDLADGREAAPLLTDEDDSVSDWTTEDPMTWYIRANALSLSDGTMNILAIEGEPEFDLTGETAPVYCFALATALKEWDDGTYIYNSWRTMTGNGYNPMAGDIAPDGTRRWLTWHPAFYGGLNSSGAMTSGIGLPPIQFISASSAIFLARKITAYDALWTDCDQQYVLSQWRLRHWTLSNSGKLEGCTAYNYQFPLAVAESNVKRVIVTKTQGANFIIGSAVCIGDKGDRSNIDRGQSYMRDVVAWARINSIDEIVVKNITYSALSLDIKLPITTTTTMYVSTMPWESGTTESVPGHSDGCRGNLTSGRYPYRIAGIEMQIGAYIMQLDPLWNVTVHDTIAHYEVYSCRSGESQTDHITSEYNNVGSFDVPASAWTYIRSINGLESEAIMYKRMGGSSSTYLRSAFFGSALTNIYSPWRNGAMYHTSYCGLPCALGDVPINSARWSGASRLAGSGKKRGRWLE